MKNITRLAKEIGTGIAFVSALTSPVYAGDYCNTLTDKINLGCYGYNKLIKVRNNLKNPLFEEGLSEQDRNNSLLTNEQSRGKFLQILFQDREEYHNRCGDSIFTHDKESGTIKVHLKK